MALPYAPGTVTNASSFNQPVAAWRIGAVTGHPRLSNLQDGTLRLALLGYSQLAR